MKRAADTAAVAGPLKRGGRPQPQPQAQRRPKRERKRPGAAKNAKRAAGEAASLISPVAAVPTPALAGPLCAPVPRRRRTGPRVETAADDDDDDDDDEDDDAESDSAPEDSEPEDSEFEDSLSPCPTPRRAARTARDVADLLDSFRDSHRVRDPASDAALFAAARLWRLLCRRPRSDWLLRAMFAEPAFLSLLVGAFAAGVAGFLGHGLGRLMGFEAMPVLLAEAVRDAMDSVDYSANDSANDAGHDAGDGEGEGGGGAGGGAERPVATRLVF